MLESSCHRLESARNIPEQTFCLRQMRNPKNGEEQTAKEEEEERFRHENHLERAALARKMKRKPAGCG